MSLALIRLSIGRTNGTAHHGVLLDEPVTACATHSPYLAPIAQDTAHHMCQSCTRALLVITKMFPVQQHERLLTAFASVLPVVTLR